MKSVLALLILVSCASAPEQLSEKAKNLEVYTQRQTDCQVVGKFVGINKMGSKELALNSVLNQAAEVKATGVFVNQEVPNGNSINVHGTAYKCD